MLNQTSGGQTPTTQLWTRHGHQCNQLSEQLGPGENPGTVVGKQEVEVKQYCGILAGWSLVWEMIQGSWNLMLNMLICGAELRSLVEI